jgi:hypothetical protein
LNPGIAACSYILLFAFDLNIGGEN